MLRSCSAIYISVESIIKQCKDIKMYNHVNRKVLYNDFKWINVKNVSC